MAEHGYLFAVTNGFSMDARNSQDSSIVPVGASHTVSYIQVRKFKVIRILHPVVSTMSFVFLSPSCMNVIA